MALGTLSLDLNSSKTTFNSILNGWTDEPGEAVQVPGAQPADLQVLSEAGAITTFSSMFSAPAAEAAEMAEAQALPDLDINDFTIT